MKKSATGKSTAAILLPLSLTAVILIADQVTKALIVSNIGLHRIGYSFWGGFLRLIHTRNPGSAFSLGYNLPEQVRGIIFLLVPVLLLALLVWYYVSTGELTPPQRWALAGVFGGGLGNLIDRFFRTGGVVDFIDVRVFGLFGWEYWPTFNVADASVVISCIVLILTFFFTRKETA